MRVKGTKSEIILKLTELKELYLHRQPYHMYEARTPRARSSSETYGEKSYKKIRLKVLNHYSNGTMKCACCNERCLKFMTIDHINNDGSKHRKIIKMDITSWLYKNNYPIGFQILCMNCNWGKGRNHGVCPHQELYTRNNQTQLLQG